MKTYGLISDTHGYVHPDLFTIFEGVEAILHAGDVGGEHVLQELEAIAPVFAVAGNMDVVSARMPPMRVVTLDFGVAVITHSHLIPQRDLAGLVKHFKAQDPRLIVYGHTHIQYCAKKNGIWVVNPGPASRPRFNDIQSVVIASWDEDKDELTFDLRRLLQ